MATINLVACASIFSGTAVVRGSSDSLAVMVGDLDGSGVLPRMLSKVGAPPSARSGTLRAGDVVISLRGNANNAAVIDASDLDGPPLFATLDLAVIRLADPENVSPHYIATYLNLPTTQAVLAEGREGSAAKRLPLGPLKSLQLPVPDWQRQLAIVSLAREAAEERRLADHLVRLRSTLINHCLAEAAALPMKEATL
ncbi:hypothetical protein [Sphingopyxis sp. P8]|uniref:hypothetical protein n=1 Tax=Sphingopyxis sp. P8 TaxID=2763256 RepID=UPI001D0AD5B7|nr:hypothetical protein [Sphingopyxis sp. P8]